MTLCGSSSVVRVIGCRSEFKVMTKFTGGKAFSQLRDACTSQKHSWLKSRPELETVNKRVSDWCDLELGCSSYGRPM